MSYAAPVSSHGLQATDRTRLSGARLLYQLTLIAAPHQAQYATSPFRLAGVCARSWTLRLALTNQHRFFADVD